MQNLLAYYNVHCILAVVCLLIVYVLVDVCVRLLVSRMESLSAMFKTGLYINDLSMHDSSRDLVLAGTQQSEELKRALIQVHSALWHSHCCLFIYLFPERGCVIGPFVTMHYAKFG